MCFASNVDPEKIHMQLTNMKKLFILLSALVLSAMATKAEEFAFPAAEQSYTTEGQIDQSESDAAAVARLSESNGSDVAQEVRSISCSVAGGVCSTRCTTSCTVKCSKW